MFSIRRDFGLSGKIFGIPRAVLARVCAFCSSWSVEGKVIKLEIPEFPDPEKNPIKLSVDEDELRSIVGGGSGSAPENPGSAKTSLVYTNEGVQTASPSNGALGLSVDVQTRTFYDHTASSPVLYGYKRTFTYDKNGRLYSVSAETRFEIDTPVVGNITQSQ